AGELTELQRVFGINRRSGIPASDRSALAEQAERVDRHCADRPDDHHRAVWPKTSYDCLHRPRVCDRRDDRPGAAHGLQCRRRIVSPAIDVVMCAERTGQRLLVTATIDRDRAIAEPGWELDSEMAQA